MNANTNQERQTSSVLKEKRTVDRRINRTFRLEPETVEMLIRAADETGLSQGEIIETCLLEKLDTVVSKRKQTREKLREAAPEDLRELAKPEKASRPVVRGPNRS